ncbi:MAG: hypothetical protein IIW27_01015, partial [Clostridia bacterium]|nr:hypothetical protein [Clostridia bacterium]
HLTTGDKRWFASADQLGTVYLTPQDIGLTPSEDYWTVPVSAKQTAVCPGPVDTEFFSISEPTGTVSEKKKKYLISPIVVAQKALRAADKGKSVITPSRSMRMARIAAKLLPHGALMGIYQEDHYEEN